MDGVVVEQKKAEHVRGDCVDAAVLERQLGTWYSVLVQQQNLKQVTDALVVIMLLF